MTYNIDLKNSVISGYCDDKDEMRQFVYKTLMTQRYRYPIYDRRYGVEIDDLFGLPSNYVCAVLGRRISSALEQDDRVKSVTDFVFSIERNSVKANFKVNTVYGEIEASFSL
jgi:hypothetical protein